MDKRRKALKVMAETAGLTALQFDSKNSRTYLRCEAPSGAKQDFWLSEATRVDPCAEQNELSRMKRFARENPAASTPIAPAPASQPQPRNSPAMKQPTIATTAISAALQDAVANTTSTTPAAAVRQVEVIELGPREFFQLAEWMRKQQLAKVANFDVLQLEAGKHLGQPVDAVSLRSAMELTGIKEPAHWGEPTDPQAIIVRELARVMTELGVVPTLAFNKLHAKLLP